MRRSRQTLNAIKRASREDLIISKNSSFLSIKTLDLLHKDWTPALKYLKTRTIKRLFFEGRDYYLSKPILSKTKFTIGERGDDLDLKDRSFTITLEDFDEFENSRDPNKDYYRFFSSTTSAIEVAACVLA
jgi:hypothetical protein